MRGPFASVAALAMALTAMPASAALPSCTDAMTANLPSPAMSWGNSAPSTDRFFARTGMQAIHLLFQPPVLQYSFGTRDRFGIDVTFVVGPDGHVTCASLQSSNQTHPVELTDQRRALLDAIPDWRFEPFLDDGHPVSVVETLSISEEEQPLRHIDPPVGDPKEVTITQDVHPQMASYGPYHVELHGDGTAIYSSFDPNDVLGPQTYHIDAARVQALVAKLAEADFWSLRDRYRDIDDLGDGRDFDRLNVTLGGVTKSLTDDGGNMSGLSRNAVNLQDLVMSAANIDFWQKPTPATLDQLKTNGFDFHGDNAKYLLLQMMQNPGVKDDAITALIALGAPQDASGRDPWDDNRWQTLLDAALSNGRVDIARQLIASGALKPGTPLYSGLVDRAFLNAVRSGKVAAVDEILPLHPSMTYAEDGDPRHRLSVLLEVSQWRGPEEDRISVVQRLLAHGADLNARKPDGETLLYSAGGVKFALFLIAHGAGINIVDKIGQTPLSQAFDENVALLMLTHGANPRLGSTGQSLRFNIKYNHWMVVRAWLEQHGHADVLAPQPGDH